MYVRFSLFIYLLTAILKLNASQELLGRDGDEDNNFYVEEESEKISLPIEEFFSGLNTSQNEKLKSSSNEKSYKYFNYRDKSSSKKFVGQWPQEASNFQKMLLNESISSQLNKYVKKHLNALLIYGSVGVGKSTLAHNIASNLNAKVYELDYTTIPVKIAIQLLVKDLMSLPKIVDSSQKKIVILKGLNRSFPLKDLSEEENLVDIFKRFIFIVTESKEEESYTERKKLSQSSFLFTCKVEQPTRTSQIQIFSQILSRIENNIDQDQLHDLCSSRKEKFNGHKLEAEVEKSLKIALLDHRILSYNDIMLTRKLAELENQEINLSHSLMYL
ncbi:MAG: hypothetical protein CMP11_08340 [Zetaproteobacteria bacterium]|nr:hypothetical protein [Pseudobdellovibrionaceae bacterium]